MNLGLLRLRMMNWMLTNAVLFLGAMACFCTSNTRKSLLALLWISFGFCLPCIHGEMRVSFGIPLSLDIFWIILWCSSFTRFVGAASFL